MILRAIFSISVTGVYAGMITAIWTSDKVGLSGAIIISSLAFCACSISVYGIWKAQS